MTEIKNSWGSLTITSEENLFIVKPKGVITPELIKKDLVEARKFADRAGPWFYVVDISDVLVAHPMNLFQLKKIKSLPNLHGYYVISRYSIQRLLANCGKLLVGIDRIFADLDQIRSYLARQ